MHIATVVCHYLEPQDRYFQLGSWYTSTRQALKNPDAARVLNSHLGCNFCAGESGGPRTSYRYPAKHSCTTLALSLLYTSSRERGFSPLIPTQNFGFGMASAIQLIQRSSFVSKKTLHSFNAVSSNNSDLEMQTQFIFPAAIHIPINKYIYFKITDTAHWAGAQEVYYACVYLNHPRRLGLSVQTF